MSEAGLVAQTWTPALGERVKITVVKTWGATRGLPISVRAASVTKTTRAGYVHVSSRPDAKFTRAEARLYREVVSKEIGAGDYQAHIEPVTPEQAMALPQTHKEAAAYARKLCADLQLDRDYRTLPMYTAAPILAEAEEDGVRYRMRGGLFKEGEESRFVFFGERAGEGEEYRPLDTDDHLLDIFPEFEDLTPLLGCSGAGVPKDAEMQTYRLLGFSAEVPFNAEKLGRLLRVTPQEAELLFIDCMRALQPPEPGQDDDRAQGYPDITNVTAAVRTYVAEQLGRWEAEAHSAIEAHDIEVYGQPPQDEASSDA